MSNKLLMHFGCRKALGTFLKTFYSFLLLELGVSFQPLQSSYQQFSFQATHTWMKMLWEKLDKFGIVIQTAESSFQFPQRGNKFLMLVFMKQGHSREALMRLNRIRLHLQIIFLSNILLASGLRINPTVFQCWEPGVNHSSIYWPQEEPTELDFALWREAVENICPSRLRVHSMGKYVAETHRIHPWQWCPDSNTLFHAATGSVTTDEYSNTVKKLNCYTKTAMRPWQERGGICSVEEIQPEVFRVTSTAPGHPPPPTQPPFLTFCVNGDARGFGSICR
jgi:hypothetical protein